MALVPMSHPATAVKNSDGTYSVRIQHTAEGIVSEVIFGNVFFAETLANAYAAILNGEAVVEAEVTKLIGEAEPIVADVKADVKRLLSDAKLEAKTLVAEAKAEAGKLKTEAQALYEELKTEAEKLIEEAKAEAEKLISEAKAAVHTATAKTPVPTPAPGEAPATKVADEGDEV